MTSGDPTLLCKLQSTPHSGYIHLQAGTVGCSRNVSTWDDVYQTRPRAQEAMRRELL